MQTNKALQPYDEFNQALEANVHPRDWKNPEPDGRYNLVVIGAGTAGLVTAAGAAGLGARVALVERDLMGGDCLNVGCVPSKAIIGCSRAVEAVRHASRFGIRIPEGVTVDFAAIMQRVRQLRAGISHHDSASRFKNLGVDVYLGAASFSGPNTVDVNGTSLRFSKAVIATGARAAELPIPGFAEAGVLTNETVFSLTELPSRLAVIGGGPIGCELAQAFARFGSEVVLIEKNERILVREDADAVAVVAEAMQRNGVEMRLGTTTIDLSRTPAGKIVLVRDHRGEHRIAVDEVLVGVGRQPNLEGLDLAKAGVEFDCRNGVIVNDRLQTTNSSIYAAGDICSDFKFTHAADFMARIAIQNALFLGRRKASALTIPRATYTSPELAHVGLSADHAAGDTGALDTFRVDFDNIDRAILDGQTDGFIKIHTRKGSERVLGATIVSQDAGELIGAISMAITNRIGLGQIANSIHPYPTRAEAIRKAGDLYNRSRLTPLVARLSDWWLRWNR